MQRTLFLNAYIVSAKPSYRSYSLLVEDGTVSRITEGGIEAEGAEVIDLKRKEGGPFWLGPVSTVSSEGNVLMCRVSRITILTSL